MRLSLAADAPAGMTVSNIDQVIALRGVTADEISQEGFGLTVFTYKDLTAAIDAAPLR